MLPKCRKTLLSSKGLYAYTCTMILPTPSPPQKNIACYLPGFTVAQAIFYLLSSLPRFRITLMSSFKCVLRTVWYVKDLYSIVPGNSTC